jgi:hypothetical protein
MPESIADRLKRLGQHEEKKIAEAEERRKKQEKAATLAAEIRERAPNRWQERWKTFQEQCLKINDGLKPMGLSLDLVTLSGPAKGNLADFGIYLQVNGQRIQHHMRCTVSAMGELTFSRRLPSLMDTKHVAQDALDENKIADMLLRFVENARGLRSMEEMLGD